MVRQNHRLSGQEFEQTLRVNEAQGSQVCCSPWGCKELDMTQQLNNKRDCIQNYNATNLIQYKLVEIVNDEIQNSAQLFLKF